MTYIKNQILQNNALEAWAMSIRYCDYILGESRYYICKYQNSQKLLQSQ